MVGALRLAWRMQRWEIAFVAVACLALGALSGFLASEMRSLLANCAGGSIGTIPCTSPFVFQETDGGIVSLLVTLNGLLPFAVGLVLGVPIVARELEQRTAAIAWPLAGSRVRWLAWRTVPIVSIALLAVSVPAFAADQLIRARWPQDDVGFLEYGMHGVPVVMRAALALGMGVVVGAVIGRLLPALLAGVGLAIAVAVSLNLAVPLWVPSGELATTTEAEIEQAAEVNARLGVRSVSSEYRLPDGTLISDQEAETILEAAYDGAGAAEPDRATLPQLVIREIPARRFPNVVLRESVGLVAATLLLGGVAGLIVVRRRAA